MPLAATHPLDTSRRERWVASWVTSCRGGLGCKAAWVCWLALSAAPPGATAALACLPGCLLLFARHGMAFHDMPWTRGAGDVGVAWNHGMESWHDMEAGDVRAAHGIWPGGPARAAPRAPSIGCRIPVITSPLRQTAFPFPIICNCMKAEGRLAHQSRPRARAHGGNPACPVPWGVEGFWSAALRRGPRLHQQARPRQKQISSPATWGR